VEHAGGGETWSPRAVSHWFELDGVGAPSADEGEAIDPHGWLWAVFTVASDDEQSDGGRAESACEVAKVELGSYPRAPTRRIRTAGPRGTVATGGARSPPCHHMWCRARDWHGRLRGVGN
jgi:hypothetical protein